MENVKINKEKEFVGFVYTGSLIKVHYVENGYYNECEIDNNEVFSVKEIRVLKKNLEKALSLFNHINKLK